MRSFCAVHPYTERACPFRNIKKVRSLGIYRVHRAPHLNEFQASRSICTAAACPILGRKISASKLTESVNSFGQKKRIEEFLKILSLQLNNWPIKAKFLVNSINFIA